MAARSAAVVARWWDLRAENTSRRCHATWRPAGRGVPACGPIEAGVQLGTHRCEPSIGLEGAPFRWSAIGYPLSSGSSPGRSRRSCSVSSLEYRRGLPHIQQEQGLGVRA